jgi:hypothetical protein
MNLLYVGFTHFQIVKELSNKALVAALSMTMVPFTVALSTETLFLTHTQT